MKNKIIDYLKNKKILLLGYGREGKSFYKFIKDYLPQSKIDISDIKDIEVPSNSLFYKGDEYLKYIDEYDLIIKSPGVVLPEDINLEKITSMTEIFLNAYRSQVIGITGTKGKSTTSSLIYHILSTLGKDTILLGNIGKPAFDYIDDINEDTIIVYELSCHQLERIKVSPHIAVLLNIYEEHLDHYHTIEEYIQTKKNIYTYQNDKDYLIYGDIDKYINKEELDKIVSQKYDFRLYDFNIKTKLIGEHNLKNIKSAIIACKLVGLKDEDILKAVESFKPLEHRLEPVGIYHDIMFYNDSIATASESVMNAVKSLKNVNTLILGGMDRGLNYEELVKFLINSSVENIILLPGTNEVFKKLFAKYEHNKKIYDTNDMEEAVDLAFKHTKKHMICLLSPAAASYGYYQNFEKRGEHFKSLVQNY